MYQIDYLGKTGSNWIKSHQVGYSWFEMFQICSNSLQIPFKLDQIGSNWIKLDQKVKSDGSAKIWGWGFVIFDY